VSGKKLGRPRIEAKLLLNRSPRNMRPPIHRSAAPHKANRRARCGDYAILSPHGVLTLQPSSRRTRGDQEIGPFLHEEPATVEEVRTPISGLNLIADRMG
jgi:hypothetical protein